MDIQKILGGALLVSGTTIGVSLLGLPVTCCFMGFYPTIILFIISWAFMLASGIFFVDAVCHLKKNVNIISLSQKIIGRWGVALSWIFSLLLLYSLVALYISGSTPLFEMVISKAVNVNIDPRISNFLLPGIFGWLIYLGTKGVDIINRYLMVGLVSSYLILVALLPEYIDQKNLMHYAFSPIPYALPSILTGFGYHIIIPTLGSYVNYNRRMMIYSIVFGSILALVINLLWMFLVMGSLSLPQLATIWRDGVPIIRALDGLVKSELLFITVNLFSFFAIFTSFLGVALSLSDLLIDGLKIKKTWEGRLLAIFLTFVPPLFFVNIYQRGFVLALEYAGVFVAVLLVFLPAMMVWRIEPIKFYKTIKGKAMVLSVMFFSLIVVISVLLTNWGLFNDTLNKIGGV